MQFSNRPRPSHLAHLTESDRAQIAAEYNRRHIVRRVRRVAKVAIIATKTGATSRKRRITAYKRQLAQAILLIPQNKYRIAAASFLFLFAIGTFITPFLQATDTKPITLADNVKSLIGDTRDDAKSYLKYDESKKQYSFEVPKDTSDTNFQHTGRNADAYSASLAQNPSDGIVVTDKKTAIVVNIRPQFFTSAARRSTTDNVVYRAGVKQLIYTLKYNGLKEDIIVPSYQDATMDFAFTLRLPVGVEARLDNQGNIGIFSGDTSLYGAISYGSDADRTLVDKAREKSEKNNLVMTIPFPIVKEADGTEHSDHARFEMGNVKTVKDKAVLAENVPADVAQKLSSESTFNEYPLFIKAYNLRDLTYPISIDPTIQVTSSAEFSKLTSENATIDTTNNLIKRTSLTGGLLGSWSSLSNFDTNNATRSQAVVGRAPDGSNYIYVIGDRTTDIRYAKINTDGSLGGWGSMPVAYPEAIAQASVMSYNGYVYVAGGNLVTNNEVDHVYVGKILANGIISSWSPTSPLAQAVYMAGNFAYNNRLYLVAGYTNLEVNTVQYATINADGTLTNWVTTTGVPSGRSNAYAAAYNSMAYLIGGDSGPNAPVNTVYGGRINDDGTISSWQTLNSMTTNRAALFVGIYGGYLYAVGGCSAQSAFSCSTFQDTTEFAEIYANGSIGTWRSSTTFSNARTHAMGVVSNNFIYLIGGCSALDNFLNETCGSTQQTVQYTQVQPVGTVGSFQSQSNYDITGREGAAVLVARSAIWLFGGYDGTNYLNTVRKATINSDGTINAWSTAPDTLPKAKAYSSIVNSPNGAVVYIFGGYGNCGLLNSLDYCDDWEAANYGGSAFISSWTPTVAANLPTARSGMTAVFNRNYVYLMGGADSNGVSNTVWRGVPTTGAALNNAGCGNNNWCVDTSFNNARTDATAIHDNNYIYLIGGRNGGTYYRTVQYALIGASNGALSSNSCGTSVTWCTTTTINTDRSAHSAFVRNGYIYIAGGCNTGSGCTTDLNNIEYAPVNGANGALGSWVTNPQSFTTARSYASIGHHDGYMYVLGGNTGSSRAVDVQSGYIGNGGVGKLTDFTAPSTAALTSARSHLAAAAYNGYIYIAGGCTAFSSGACTSMLNSIEYAKINTDGSFSTNSCGTSVTWCPTTNLSDTRFGGQIMIFGGYLYYFGGTNSTGVTNSVDSIALTGSGTLAASWNTPNNPPDFITARTRFAMTSTDTHVYVVNGQDNTPSALSTGEYATLLPNGTLSAWSSFTSALSSVNGRPVTFIANNRLYIVGGSVFVSGFHSALNADGSVNGSWTQQPWVNTFPTDAVGFAADGYLYYGAGDALLRLNLVAAGGIEPSTENYNFTNNGGVHKHDGGAGVYYKGNYYLLGGCDAGYGLDCTSLNDLVQYAGVKAIPRTASITKLYDFDTGVKPTKLITRGNRNRAGNLSGSYSTTNNANTTLSNASSVEIINYTGANATTINLGTNRTLSRYLSLTYRFDDTSAVAYPEIGQESYITDFDLYYVSNPGSRLRGGRTFTNGVDRGLDVQPQ